MTKQQSAILYKSKWWKKLTPLEMAIFQINEPLLCMPFGDFRKAVEKSLGRPIQTLEFGFDSYVEKMKLELSEKMDALEKASL